MGVSNLCDEICRRVIVRDNHGSRVVSQVKQKKGVEGTSHSARRLFYEAFGKAPRYKNTKRVKGGSKESVTSS